MYILVLSLSNLGSQGDFIMSNKISEKEILDDLIRIKNIINRTPQQKDITEHGIYSINVYKRAFGGINNALLKIGCVPEVYFGYEKEDVINEIKRLQAVLNKAPTSAEFSANAKLSYITARKIFDNMTWKQILGIVEKTNV